MRAVGRQLADRRKALDLTQQMAAKRIDITSTTVSAVERGLNEIQLGRRADWERGLGLAPGSITRAYENGVPLELVDSPGSDGPPYPGLADADERRIWEIDIPEKYRRDIIETLRSGKRERGSHSA